MGILQSLSHWAPLDLDGRHQRIGRRSIPLRLDLSSFGRVAYSRVHRRLRIQNRHHPCLLPHLCPAGPVVVDVADFQIMADNFNGRYPFDESFSRGDFDLNTRVDMKDFLAFRELFNGQQGMAAAVPEPATLWVMLAATLIWVCRRGRGR